MNTLKELPIGVSNFRDFEEENYVYVDKTQYIYNLITSRKFNFLSRPRRFGKSLLISTLEEIFLGNKELFKNQWIYNSDWEWKKHPVIRIDFNEIINSDKKLLQEGIEQNLIFNAQNYGIELKQDIYKYMFKELILNLAKKYNQSVVVLIDEYDKPIINHIGKGKEEIKKAEENRDIIKEFYGVLKSGEVSKVLRFLLLTGISKFSKVSVFSELNNLNDLTMHDKYSSILGITHNELETYFKDYIDILKNKLKVNYNEAKQQLIDYYDGYKFSSEGELVFNPFSLLKCFDTNKFENYWFESGTPTFLPNFLKEQNYKVTNLEEITLRDSQFSTFDITNLAPEAIMFQTGYLTIKDFYSEERLYTLGYPNKEVKNSFIEQLYFSISTLYTDTKFLKISRFLKSQEIDKFIEVINSIYAEIPYTLMKGNLINETYFHTLFYLMVSASGIVAETEVLTAQGRIDMVVITNEFIYIFEFKCNQSAQKAIEQIKEKNYIEKYKSLNKDIIIIGINFDPKSKNIKEYKISTLSLEELHL